MKTMPVGELKAHFSEVLDDVSHGAVVAVAYGRNRIPVAMIVPYDADRHGPGIRLGTLCEQATCTFADDFSLPDEAFLAS